MLEVKVTFEMGDSVKALVNGLVSNALTKAPVAETEVLNAPKAADIPVTKEVVPSKKKAAPEAPEKKASFADLDDEAKLEAIKTEVTKHTKKGKGSDIKWLLGQFDASSVSKAQPLSPENYNAFYDAITRYGKGEALTDIFPSNEEDLG